MKNLNICKKEFLLLLHAIWSLCSYYISLFHIIPADTPQEMKYRLDVDDTNVTHIIIEVAKNLDAPRNNYTLDDMKSIINEYISFTFATEYPEIKPFVFGSCMDMHESLYLFNVIDTGKHYTFDFVYVDSPLAYHMVKKDELKSVII